MDNTDTLSMEDDNDSTTAMYDDDDLMTPDISGSQLAEVINVRDASEAVFAIPEIMSNIYQFLDRKKDLLSCTLLCKAGFPVAAKEMFREMRKTDFAKICETDCSFVSYRSFLHVIQRLMGHW
jgi:pentatricopeptide repeat protein